MVYSVSIHIYDNRFSTDLTYLKVVLLLIVYNNLVKLETSHTVILSPTVFGSTFECCLMYISYDLNHFQLASNKMMEKDNLDGEEEEETPIMKNGYKPVFIKGINP